MLDNCDHDMIVTELNLDCEFDDLWLWCGCDIIKYSKWIFGHLWIMICGVILVISNIVGEYLMMWLMKIMIESNKGGEYVEYLFDHDRLEYSMYVFFFIVCNCNVIQDWM